MDKSGRMRFNPTMSLRFLPLTLLLTFSLSLVLMLGIGWRLPSAGQIVFGSLAAGDMNLYLLDVRTRISARVTWGAGDESQADWSPDGESLIYVAATPAGFDIVRQRIFCPDKVARCDHHPQFMTSGQVAAQPSWSPDGQWIVFQIEDDAIRGQRIARLPADCQVEDPTCIPQRLTILSTSNQLQPDWSPDGQWIAFAGDLNESFNTDLYRVPAKCFELCTGEVEQVFGGLTNDLYPQWSPDGRWLAFNYTMRSRMRVGLIDMVERRAAQRIDTGFDWVEMPAWSPQGDRLALVIYRRQQGDLYLYRLDCEGDPRRCLTRLTRDRWVEVAPAWRP
jgi:TolB protein